MKNFPSLASRCTNEFRRKKGARRDFRIKSNPNLEYLIFENIFTKIQAKAFYIQSFSYKRTTYNIPIMRPLPCQRASSCSYTPLRSIPSNRARTRHVTSLFAQFEFTRITTSSTAMLWDSRSAITRNLCLASLAWIS